jgi:dihydroorotate dehydrogenase electron transfer subunit
MPQPALAHLTVMDLVPFGNVGPQTAFYALRLTPPEWEHWSPGQFIMLRPASAGSEILWARPFSICRVTPRDLILFFQVRGRGTAAMTKLQPGDVLHVWGPLGNSFALEPETPTLLLAGGIGIAPFVGYVHAHPTPGEVFMEFGHRMPLECYPFDSINEKITLSAHLEKNGKDRESFLSLVEERVRQFAGRGLVLACGPTLFLRAVQAFALRHKARAQLCLETRMACGVGACHGCVVRAFPAPDNSAPLAAPDSFPARVPAEAGAAVPPEDNGGHRRSAGTMVQTCTCGPNFWADSVSFS